MKTNKPTSLKEALEYVNNILTNRGLPNFNFDFWETSTKIAIHEAIDDISFLEYGDCAYGRSSLLGAYEFNFRDSELIKITGNCNDNTILENMANLAKIDITKYGSNIIFYQSGSKNTTIIIGTNAYKEKIIYFNQLPREVDEEGYLYNTHDSSTGNLGKEIISFYIKEIN